MKLFVRKGLVIGLFLLSGSAASLHAQTSNNTIRFTREDVYQFHRNIQDEIARKVLDGVVAGKLHAYEDAEVKGQALKVKDLKGKLPFFENGKCIGRESPFAKLHIDYGHIQEQKSLELTCFYSKPESDPFTFYVSVKDASALLSQDEKQMLQRMDTWKDSDLGTDNALRPFGDSIIMRLARPMYRAASTGKLKAFPDASLKSKLSNEEVRRIGAICETISIARDADHPDDLVDSTVCEAFDLSEIEGFSVSEECKKKGEKSSCKSLSVAPTYRPAEGGLVTDPVPMFHLSWGDAMKQVSKEDQAYLQMLVEFMREFKKDDGKPKRKKI